MEKVKVGGISASGIIFPASNPVSFFAEVKDGTYPVKVFRNALCCIGGNWIGSKAKTDANPRNTFLREMDEELSFEKPIQSTLELVDLGQIEYAEGYSVTSCVKEPTVSDRGKLDFVKHAIRQNARHFADNIQHVPKEVFLRTDPESKRDAVLSLNSFFVVPLSDEEWEILTELQNAFGNLSNESISLVTTLEKMIAVQQLCSWGYDRVLQKFFLASGFPRAANMSLFPGVEVRWPSGPFASYEEYLERYEVAKRP